MQDLQLGYLGFSSQVPELTSSFFHHVLGMELTEPVSGESRRLRMDDRPWRFAIEGGTRNDITYLGLDVPNHNALADVVERLRCAGFEVYDGGEAQAHQRGVTRLMCATDPDGLSVELAYGARSAAGRPFVSPFGVQFVTGPLGVGHVVLSTRDLTASLRFYRDGLGFRVTDFADIPADTGEVRQVTFLRCNARHHSLALVPAELPRRLRHIMVEMASVDDVGRVFDRALNKGLISRGLGRHTNDRMLSFYVTAPGGLEIEIGCDGMLVDDASWTVSRYVGRPSSWGHHIIRDGVLLSEEKRD